MIAIEKNNLITENIKDKTLTKWLTLFPILGVLFYVLFFFIAKAKYAGGMEEYQMDEYLMCDMLEKISRGGFPNPGRLFAIIGHVFLFIGMITFFYLLPKLFKQANLNTRIFQSMGMLSMAFLLFIFTSYHDSLVLAAGIVACIAAFPMIYEYYHLESSVQKYCGVFCLIMSLLVFIGYQTQIGTAYLPLFQKLVYVLDSLWVFLVCWQIRKQYSTTT